jgi:hypothetical protein
VPQWRTEEQRPGNVKQGPAEGQRRRAMEVPLRFEIADDGAVRGFALSGFTYAKLG